MLAEGEGLALGDALLAVGLTVVAADEQPTTSHRATPNATTPVKSVTIPLRRLTFPPKSKMTRTLDRHLP
jgi:hypothetical protein